MNGRDVVQRLRAYDAGGPLPRGETLHFSVADDPDTLVIAFIRMGGESRPWGIAFGHPGKAPTVLTVPEGRNRDLVADMCADFAPILLKHLRTPNYVSHAPANWEDLRPIHQVWLPNASHLDMLHHLAYAYTFTKWGAGKRGRLNTFGRACGWLFREAQRPGQQQVIVATQALRESFVFPAQDMRQGHLGYLLAWLASAGDLDTRMAAAMDAEHHSISASLDPDFERAQEDLVNSWLEARRDANEAAMKDVAKTLDARLAPELTHRYDLCVDAINVLRQDDRRVNAGVSTLVDEGLKEQWYQHTRQELKLNDGAEVDGPVFVSSPETDRSPAAAGSRYQVHLASADLWESLLLHDDVELQADAIAAGNAFRGTIEAVYDEAEGRGSIPVWTISDPIGGPLRLRLGSRVCVVGLPKRAGVIRAIEDRLDGSREYEIEILGWKTKPDSAADPSHVGKTLTFVSQAADGINRMKSMRIWSADGPGAWLTHQRPRGPRTAVVDEAAEDLTVKTVAGDDD
jgi:hypothetical protein